MTRIDAEIAVDTEIVELVKRLGTGPNQLAFTTEFTQLFRRKLESLPEETDLRVAAIREMRTWSGRGHNGVAEMAVDNARAGVASPFQSVEAQDQWRQWAAQRLTDDPFISTWSGMPIAWPRDRALEEAVERIIDELPEQLPDVAAALAPNDRQWLAADLHQVVHHNLPEPQTPDPLWSAEVGGGFEIIRPGRRDIKVSYRMGQWAVSRDGGATWESRGTHYRAAQGRAEELAGILSPDPQVAAMATAVTQTRTELGTRVRAIIATDELIGAVARSEDLTAYESAGVYSLVTAEAVRRALVRLDGEAPDLIAAVERQGLDPIGVLREQMIPTLLRDLRKANSSREADDLFTEQDHPDLHMLDQSSVTVGDLDGEHVVISVPHMDLAQVWTAPDAGIAAPTLTEAIEAARAHLAGHRTESPAQAAPQVEATAEAPDSEPAPEEADTASVLAEPISDVEPIRNADGSITWARSDATEATPDEEADATVNGPAEQAPLLPQVPQAEMGEPITAWRGKTLIEAERPDGSRVRVSAETLARHNLPDTATQPEPVESPQVEVPTPQAPETVEAEPRAPARTVPATDFTLGTEVLVPAAVRDRIEANIAAIRIVKTLDSEGRNADPAEQAQLARWSGWGGAWQVFDNQKREWDQHRAELRTLLTDRELDAGRRSTTNAHYTDPALTKVMWDALAQAGLPEQARVVEPGCGAGHFIGHAPAGVRMVGVELDAMTSRIAHRLYPNQQVRNHGFERDFAPDGVFTAAIGNVPFGNYKVYDDKHNPNGQSIHNHFIRKSLAMVEPGGYVATITSAFTSDGARTSAREEIAELGDLVGAIRLPSKAFDRQAKTDVVTDLLIFRRRESDREQTRQTQQWIKTSSTRIDDEIFTVNDYFQAHPENVLGTMRVGNGLHGRTSLNVDAYPGLSLAEQIRRRLTGIVERAKVTGLALTASPADLSRELPWDRPGLITAAEVDPQPIPGALRFNEVENAFEQYTIGSGWLLTSSKGQVRTSEWQALLAMGDTVLELVDASRTETTFAEREALRSALNRQYDAYFAKHGPVNRYKWTSHTSRNTDEQARKKFPTVEKNWREQNGEPRIGDDGEPVVNAKGRVLRDPVEGDLPDDVVAELWERAYTPTQGPYKKRSHLEGVIKYDPRIALVRGIERFDDDTLESSKASIFTEDVSSVFAPATSAETIDEAIAITFDEKGTIDPQRMAELLGTNVDEVLVQARGKIFPDLNSDDEWVVRAQFLSGNVREKLTHARARAVENPARYSEAADALAATVPMDVDPSKIGLRPGAAWIGTDVYRQFLVEEFTNIDLDRLELDYAAVSGSWTVKTKQYPSWADPERGYRDNWGSRSGNISGLELFEAMCNNRPIQSYKTKEELETSPKPAFHKGRTEELRDNAERLEERFGQWLWADPERTDRLTRLFNDRFNSFVRLQHDIEHKQFPGLNPKYTPYPYQAQAAVRLVNDETILLDHCVGAGKTLTIAMSCMEMKRLGQVQQPWIVVPNHLIDQWHREVLDAYPGANVLVASDLADSADRQRFMGQSATGSWDMVIVPESKFKLMAVSPDTQIDYIQGEVDKLAFALEAAKTAGSGHTVKEIEKAVANKEEQLAKLIKAKGKDNGLTFEQTGCDFLYVDEAHMYKNLSRPSNSSDLSVVEGAQRATDMDMKINYLRQKAITRNIEAGRPDAPAKAVAFATGTPVSNSMSELWVMKKYLRPDLLRGLDMEHIDAWAQAFARQRTNVEMNVTGTQLRTVSRMAQYTNLPQMIAMVDQFRDVVVRDQIPAALPTLTGGGRTIVEFGMGQVQRDFMHDLDVRMERTTGKTAHLDNALKIGGDGRNAPRHPRLANLANPDRDHDRVVKVVDQVWRVYTSNADLHTPADDHGQGGCTVQQGMGQVQRDFMHDLDVRMERTTGKTAHLDNALKIGGDGRNASLHPRLANLANPDRDHDRVVKVVDQVWRVYTSNADLHTPADDHGPTADGVFQMIFCDRGTPKAGSGGKDTDLYSMIRQQLVERGMAAEEVAFIHDFPQAKDKQKLFADCRSGKVRVLLGSTEKMSTGVNAQRLLKALHHMDCPYRPADLEQREGRILRQGNVNAEVEILNYVAERSFDATMWQIVERKAFYIQQLRTGDLPYAIEDVGGDMALSAAQTKAAATGDPIYVQAVEKEAEVKKLVNEEQAIAQTNTLNEYMIRKFTIELPILRQEVEELRTIVGPINAWFDTDRDRRKITIGDAPILRQEVEELRTIVGPINAWFDTDRDRRKITIGDATVVDGDSEKVGEAVRAMVQDRYTHMRMNKTTEPETWFEVAGVAVYSTYHPEVGTFTLSTDGGVTRYFTAADATSVMSSNASAHGLMTRVRNMLKDVDKAVGVAERDIAEMTNRLAAVQAEPVREFSKADELRRARAELAEMNADINARENSPVALKQYAEETDRRRRAGQYPGWTLDLNPTRGHAEEYGITRQELSAEVPARMQVFAADWIAGEADREEARRRDPWLPRSADGSVFHLGGERESGLPGGRVEWTDRMWHWMAWDGHGRTESGLVEQRNTARSAAQSAAVSFAKEAEINSAYLYERAAAQPEVAEQAPATPSRTDTGRRPAWEVAQGPLTPPAAAAKLPACAVSYTPRQSEHISRVAENRRDEGRTR
ncbi:hypothetical protein Pd630_LPD10047 (plasmid) [Rhodococcus opacus PD630]|nr:hypothetical protein Pd630_LPD10047 [Rhodococcus opacus PD630]